MTNKTLSKYFHTALKPGAFAWKEFIWESKELNTVLSFKHFPVKRIKTSKERNLIYLSFWGNLCTINYGYVEIFIFFKYGIFLIQYKHRIIQLNRYSSIPFLFSFSYSSYFHDIQSRHLKWVANKSKPDYLPLAFIILSRITP